MTSKVQVGSLEPPYSLDVASNLHSKHLYGTKFSSNSDVIFKLSSLQDVKTVTENWLNRQERDFYQAGLNKLVLRSDKCLNRFGDYVEKLSASMPLNSLWNFLSNVNKEIFITLVNFFWIHPISKI
ncbi:hypothetical protein AVEN_118546-1 [Araneus ventricosus]|uniref:Uncharacterized protein n=1 Tax=Araneus ventricosus TaxID=182803 RepID=A0A4Y2AWL4_ARAVE|nr:hypothetical protein AVEN_118546-1 [Araneus ventricosus]